MAKSKRTIEKSAAKAVKASAPKRKRAGEDRIPRLESKPEEFGTPTEGLAEMTPSEVASRKRAAESSNPDVSPKARAGDPKPRKPLAESRTTKRTAAKTHTMTSNAPDAATEDHRRLLGLDPHELGGPPPEDGLIGSFWRESAPLDARRDEILAEARQESSSPERDAGERKGSRIERT